VVLTGMLYFTKKKVWHDIKEPGEIARSQDPKTTTI
jgi:hypothetical protein